MTRSHDWSGKTYCAPIGPGSEAHQCAWHGRDGVRCPYAGVFAFGVALYCFRHLTALRNRAARLEP